MIRANAKNMVSDVLLSASVLIGVLASNIFGSGAADTVVAVLIGGWIIKTAVGIFLEASLELMDGGEGPESYQAIFDAVEAVDGASNPHRARMRRIAGFWDIDLDIEVDPELSVSEAHLIATRVEEEIKGRLENVFDIMVHVEPRDDCSDEGYGLSAGSSAKTESTQAESPQAEPTQAAPPQADSL
jgi:cation diffusion facilitator family transporter